MSDFDTTIPDTSVTDPTDADAGVVDTSTSEPDGTATAPASPTLDVDQYGNHLVPVKVNGDVQMVPLSEATQGYSRQQDYTAKTQALAAEREEIGRAYALVQALEENPAETVRVLSEVYEVDLSTAAEMAAEALEDADPLQQRLDAIERRFVEQDQQAIVDQLQQTLDRAVEATGVNPDAVLERALAMGTQDLESVAKVLAFEGSVGDQATQEARQQKVDAKRGAAAAVHSGGSPNATTVSSPPTIDSFEAAANAALAQHGYDLTI